MRILLDTHILLWCLDDVKRLPEEAKRQILAADEIYASVVNIWEVAIKISIGKIKLSVDLRHFVQEITRSGFRILDIKPDHPLRLAELENIHRDPFDRMLVAQSISEPLHLMTCDTLVAKYKSNIILI